MKPLSGEATKNDDGMGRVQRRQYPRDLDDVNQPVDRDHRKPDQHHRAKEVTDARGAAPLHEKKQH